ncbi:hypothetical protein BaRGS_00034805, partial [Batillaria attramentaria]
MSVLNFQPALEIIASHFEKQLIGDGNRRPPRGTASDDAEEERPVALDKRGTFPSINC